MKLFTKTSYMAIAAAAVLAMSTPVQAQVTTSSNASVTTAAAFTVTETSALSFGTIVASRRGGGGGAVATLAIGADAANSVTVTNVGGATDDFIVSSVDGDRAEFTIASALATTAMNIELPSSAITLSCGACAPGNPDFSVDTFLDDGGDDVVTSDGSGDATFYVGATLSTVAGTANYEANGSYTGTYNVTVAY